MPLTDQGFLSEPFNDVREEIRNRFAKWRTLLLQVNANCVEAQHSLSISRGDDRQLLGATLFVRTLASTQAAAILLEYGLVPQARTILRAALETLFMLCAITKKPELTQKIIRSHEADRRKVVDRINEWKDPELRKLVEQHITKEELNEFAASKEEELNIFKLAQDAEMEDWYRGHYLLLSFPAHGKVSDLARHVVTNQAGEVQALKNEPEIDDQESSWAYTIEFQLKAAESLEDLFGGRFFESGKYRNDLRALITQE